LIGEQLDRPLVGGQCAVRIRDRERKWLRRKTSAGRFKRQVEYEARLAARRGSAAIAKSRVRKPLVGERLDAVVNYGVPHSAALS
jgi:hypothetical protein